MCSINTTQSKEFIDTFNFQAISLVLLQIIKSQSKALTIFLDSLQKGKLGPVSVRIGVAESDQEAVASWNNLSKGQKLTAQLSLDASQKLVVKVSTAIKLHQVFVMLRRKNDKREIAFVAQPETAGKTDYKLEVDMTANAKDLSYKSGVYEVILFLGDFSIDDSTEWQVGEVKVQLPAGKPKDVNPLYAVNYGPKPEIKVRLAPQY